MKKHVKRQMFKIMLILVMYIVKKYCYLLLFAVCMCCMQMWELVSIVYIIEKLKLTGTSYILSNLIGQKYTDVTVSCVSDFYRWDLASNFIRFVDLK